MLCGNINQRTAANPSAVKYCEFLSQLNLTLQFLYLFGHEPRVMVQTWHGPPEMHALVAWFLASRVTRVLLSAMFSCTDELIGERATNRLKVTVGSGFLGAYLGVSILSPESCSVFYPSGCHELRGSWQAHSHTSHFHDIKLIQPTDKGGSC